MIEIGKRYITWDGQLTGPVQLNQPGQYYPYIAEIDGVTKSFTKDGKFYYGNRTSYLDLVGEYVDEVEQEGIRLLSEELEELSKSNHVPEIDEESGDEEELEFSVEGEGPMKVEGGLVENEEQEYRVFETGSRRDSDKGKPRIQDLLAYTRLRFGYHLTLGGEKYGFSNFRAGQPNDSSLASIDRHLAALMQGDMSEDHASAIIFGMQLIMMNQEKDGIQPDHFYKRLTKNK